MSSSLCKREMSKEQLLFSLGVTVALTGDVFIAPALLPARLICTLVCGLPLSAGMGQARWVCAWPRAVSRLPNAVEFVVLFGFCHRRNNVLSLSFLPLPSPQQFSLVLWLSLIGAIDPQGSQRDMLQPMPTWPRPCWS